MMIMIVTLVLLGLITILVCNHLLKNISGSKDLRIRSRKDRLIDNYEKGLNEGRKVLGTVATVLLKGGHVADTAQFIALKDKKRENIFKFQLSDIIAKKPVRLMDITLLNIINKFILDPICGTKAQWAVSLQGLIKQCKDKRNEISHEKHLLYKLPEADLKSKISELKPLYSDILAELELGNSDETLLINNVRDEMEETMEILEKTIDDELEEIAAKCIQEKSELQIETAKTKNILKVETDKTKKILEKETDKVTKATEATVKSKDEMVKVAAKASEETVKATKATAKATEATEKMVQVAAKATEESAKATEETVKATKVTAKATEETVKATEATAKATEATEKMVQVAAKVTEETVKATEVTAKASEATEKMVQVTAKATEETAKAMEETAKATEATAKATETIEKLIETKSSWKDKTVEVSESMNIELIKNLVDTCKIQMAEGLDGCYKASPLEIMSDFLMFKIGRANGWDTEQIPYRSVLLGSKDNDVIILKGNSGMGKTTFSKFVGSAYSSDKKGTADVDNKGHIDDLTSYDHLLYMECRNKQIKSFDDLLKHIFPKTLSKFNIPIDEFKGYILEQKLLIIVDGYDEVDPTSTAKAVKEIFHLRSEGMKIIITTRPVSLAEIKCIIPETKEYVTMEMLGIPKSQFKKFVMRILKKVKKFKHETERENTCKELVSQLERLEITLGNFLHSPMILTNLTILHVENPNEIKTFMTSSDVYQGLQDMKLIKISKKMNLKSKLIEEFIAACDKVGAETFIVGKYDVLPDEKVCELESKLENLGIPKEQVMSCFFASYEYRIGMRPFIGYKYCHRSEQEYLLAKYMGMAIIRYIMSNLSKEEDYVLKRSLIWNFIIGKISETELEHDRKQLSRFKNVFFFLIGVLATSPLSASQPQPKEIFQKISDKLISIGWYLDENTEWLNVGYQKYDNTGPKDEQTNIGEEVAQISEDDLDASMEEEVFHSKAMDKILDLNLGLGTETKIKKVQEEEDETTKYGKEDNLLRCVLESKINYDVKNSAIMKLSTISCWKITRSECLKILNDILETKGAKMPEKIVLSIEYDPPALSDFHKTISLLTEKQIPVELFLEHNFHSESSDISNTWLNPNVNVVEFLGSLKEDEAQHLPITLKALHVRVDECILETFNQKLMELSNIDVLGLRIILNKDTEFKCLPRLEYRGTDLCIILVCEVEDDHILWLAATVNKLCPKQRNGKLTGFWLQKSKLTDAGIENLLFALQQNEISVTGWIKIWTSEESYCTLKDLDDLAHKTGHNGLQVFNTLSVKEMIPKKMINKQQVIDMPAIKVEEKFSNTKDVDKFTSPVTKVNVAKNPLMTSEEDINILKLFMAVRQESPTAVALAFIYTQLTKVHSGQTIEDYYKNINRNFNKEFTANEKDILSDPSWDPFKMDVIFLYKMLQKVCGLHGTSDPVWQTPGSIEYHLRNIKNTKNYVAHELTKLSNQELKVKFAELENSFICIFNTLSLSSHSELQKLKDGLDSILNTPLSVST